MIAGSFATALRLRSGSGLRWRCDSPVPSRGIGPLRPASASAKRSMESSRPRDIFDICSAEAASSVELEVDCCTSSRMRSMAFTTACAPEACSSTAELISWVISLSRVVARGDLRRTVRLLVGGRTDLLGELVDLGDHVRDLAQRRRSVRRPVPDLR